jgi:hypothetical protein
MQKCSWFGVMTLTCAMLLSIASAVSAASNDERAIEELEVRLAQGLEARDRKALEPLLAGSFTWVHASDGRVDDREAWLSNAARGMALSGQRSQRSEHGPRIAMHGTPAHTAIRLARVRLLDAPNKRESWLRQSRVFAREADGAWRLALGQGVVMYEGPILDAAMHERYAGRYAISPDRTLLLSWEDGWLFATFPGGAKSQIFLASPTEEAARTSGAGRLTFELDESGRPATVLLVRGTEVVWRAERVTAK